MGSAEDDGKDKLGIRNQESGIRNQESGIEKANT
jgi:hypothetical protein